MHEERLRYTAFWKPHTESHRSVYIWRLEGKRETVVGDDLFVSTASILIDSRRDAYAKHPLGFVGTICPGEHPVLFIPAGCDRCFLLVLWRVEGLTLSILGFGRYSESLQSIHVPCNMVFLSWGSNGNSSFQVLYKRPPTGRGGLPTSGIVRQKERKLVWGSMRT